MWLRTGFPILDPSLTPIPQTSLKLLARSWRVCGVSYLLCRQYFVKGTWSITGLSATSSAGLELVFARIHDEIYRRLVGYPTIRKYPGPFLCINDHFHDGVLDRPLERRNRHQSSCQRHNKCYWRGPLLWLQISVSWDPKSVGLPLFWTHLAS